MKGCETIIGNLPFCETAMDGSKSSGKIQNDYIIIQYSMNITVLLTNSNKHTEALVLTV